jgi:CBS domain-containing protein
LTIAELLILLQELHSNVPQYQFQILFERPAFFAHIQPNLRGLLRRNIMTAENQTIGDIMLSLSAFPCMKESATVQEAILQLRSFCPMGSAVPCGFSELMVVDEKGGLVGRVTHQGILRVLFSSLFHSVDNKNFENQTDEFSDLATLLDGVMLKEGAHHLNASLSKVVERGIKVLPATYDLIHAMSVMVICKETSLPVEENGKLVGVVRLAEVFGALGDQLMAKNCK